MLINMTVLPVLMSGASHGHIVLLGVGDGLTVQCSDINLEDHFFLKFVSSNSDNKIILLLEQK